MWGRCLELVRRLQVKSRLSLALVGIVAPALLTSLSLLWALHDSDRELEASIDSALGELIPITRLELQIQQTRTELDRLSGTSVAASPPALIPGIAHQFIQLEARLPRALSPEITSAYRSWQSAVPMVRAAEQQALLARFDPGELSQAERNLEQAIGWLKRADYQLQRDIMRRYQDARREQHLYERALFWVWAVGIAGVLLLLYLLSASILQPLAELKAAASAIRRGEFDARVALAGRDEFTTVGRVFNDMATTVAQTQQQLHDSANHDALTGLLNRRGLDQYLAQQLPLERPLCLLLIDVDHFKTLNDQHGHHVGDQVLTGLAQRMQQLVRASDGLGRYGGDEFIVVLPDLRAEQASTLARRLIDSVDQWRTESGYPIGISIGLAEKNLAPMSAAELIRAADAALYRSKHAGRGTLRMQCAG